MKGALVELEREFIEARDHFRSGKPLMPLSADYMEGAAEAWETAVLAIRRALTQEAAPAEPDEPFVDAIQRVINRYSKEGESDTPDFILAQYLDTCLDAFGEATRARERWHGRLPSAESYSTVEKLS